MNVLPPSSKEIIQAVYSSVGVDEQRVKEAVKILREWLELQPHLPHVMDDKRLENLFLRSKASIEKAKSTIDMYYTLRTAVTEFHCERDPEKPWFKTASDSLYFVTMPNLTEDNYRVSFCGILNDQVKFDLLLCAKMCYLCLDVLLAQDCSAGIEIIYDGNNVTLPMVAQMTPTTIQKIVLCSLKGLKCRVKAIHFLNVPSYAVHIIKIAKSLLKSTLASRIHVHPPGYEKLHNYLSPKVLPRDMGGDAESISELWDAWKKKLLSSREWLVKEEAYKADESRRPGKPLTSGDLFGVEGSFRQLSVD